MAMLVALAGVFFLSPDPAWSHGITLWAEVLEDGRTVSVEAYYSDGQPAAGVAIRVFVLGEDPDGSDSGVEPGGAATGNESQEEEDEALVDGKTDSQGKFRFSPEFPNEAPCGLRIQAIAGGHHRSEAEIAASEFRSRD